MTKQRFVEEAGTHSASIDAEKGETRSALWLLSVETGERRRLTSGQANDTAPAWSPDGKQIAFLSTRDGKAQVYVITVDGGEAFPLTSLKQGAGGGPDWSPDGKWIAFTAGPQGEPPDPKKPYLLTRSIIRFNDIGYLDATVQDIYLLPAAGGKPRRITQDGCFHLSPKWSPDGNEILNLFMAAPDSHYPETSLQVIDRKGKVTRTLEGWGEVDAAEWLPDGKGIALVGQPAGKPIGSKNDLWVLLHQGETPECRTAGLQYAVGGGIQPDFPF
ncbi:MAG: S9 family peptidase, partial [Chloroflexi bacterium]|nr:S9 family peptidase [Chloroflexota bacterium]